MKTKFLVLTVTVATLIATVLLAGCAKPPVDSEIRNAYYGRPMEQAECEKIAERVMMRLPYKDPTSVILRFGLCRKGYKPESSVHKNRFVFGYVIEGTVNAKNSFGGYVGPQPFYVIIRDGRAIIRGEWVDGLNSFWMFPTY